MKSLISAFAFLASTYCFFAQNEDKYLEKITFSQTQDIKFFEDVKNNTAVGTYELSDLNQIKVGDTLYLGLPSSIESFSSTRANAGLGGTKLNSRTTNVASFSQVQLGRPAGFGSIMSAMSGEAPLMAGQSLQNTITVVREIRLYHKGSKKKPLNVVLVLGEPNDRAFGANKYLSVLDTENAYQIGEIRLANRLMTREEAIAKLKEAKDLLDLGLMTQEDYDAIKEKMTPIIMGGN
jgi:hypothetical protein